MYCQKIHAKKSVRGGGLTSKPPPLLLFNKIPPLIKANGKITYWKVNPKCPEYIIDLVKKVELGYRLNGFF